MWLGCGSWLWLVARGCSWLSQWLVDVARGPWVAVAVTVARGTWLAIAVTVAVARGCGSMHVGGCGSSRLHLSRTRSLEAITHPGVLSE